MKHFILPVIFFFFFFNDTATTEIYTLSLHDALPISHAWEIPRAERSEPRCPPRRASRAPSPRRAQRRRQAKAPARSEEHTSELQSLAYLVCRLLLEKKKKV